MREPEGPAKVTRDQGSRSEDRGAEPSCKEKQGDPTQGSSVQRLIEHSCPPGFLQGPWAQGRVWDPVTALHFLDLSQEVPEPASTLGHPISLVKGPPCGDTGPPSPPPGYPQAAPCLGALRPGPKGQGRCRGPELPSGHRKPWATMHGGWSQPTSLKVGCCGISATGHGRKGTQH